MNGESVCPAAPDSGGEKSAIQKRRRRKVSGTAFLIPKHGSEHVIPTQMPVSSSCASVWMIMVVATVSQQVDVASPNQRAAFTGHSSVSQSVSRSKFEQRCAAVRSSIHSRADRGEGAAARRGGERTDPLPGAGATNGRRAARTERTSYLSTRPTSVRAGEFPPLICYRSARVNKGLRPLNRAFLTLFSNTARKQFLSASNSTEETLGVGEPYNMRACGRVCVCVWLVPSSCSFILMNTSPGHPALALSFPPSLLSQISLSVCVCVCVCVCVVPLFVLCQASVPVGCPNNTL